MVSPGQHELTGSGACHATATMSLRSSLLSGSTGSQSLPCAGHCPLHAVSMGGRGVNVVRHQARFGSSGLVSQNHERQTFLLLGGALEGNCGDSHLSSCQDATVPELILAQTAPRTACELVPAKQVLYSVGAAVAGSRCKLLSMFVMLKQSNQDLQSLQVPRSSLALTRKLASAQQEACINIIFWVLTVLDKVCKDIEVH